MTKKYQVIARKYRPKMFCEVLGQEAAVTTLKNALKFDKAAHAYLFCGSRGVGKTTLARLFAKALNCQQLRVDWEPCNTCASCVEISSGQSLDVIEIDGASNRGIDDIRQINETVSYAPSHGKYKIYIIDEVHMLTKEAFNALLKTLEEPPERAKFFFATTEAHKVLPTIISRCQRFDLGRIQSSQIIAKLEQISQDLQRTVEPEALYLIATFAEGSLRDAESLFDQILCFAEGPVSAAAVRQSLGLVPQEHFFALDTAFSEYRLSYAFELVDHLFQTGKDLVHFLEQLIEHYRCIALCKTFGEQSSPERQARYAASARLYTQPQAMNILEMLIHAESQFQKSAFQRIALESILLQIIRSRHKIPIEVLVRRLCDLEQSLKGDSPTVSTHTASLPPVAEPLEPEIKPEIKTDPTHTSCDQPPAKHPSHYDTLMRFAAIELEGTLKI
jgi:DNA polymerase-3 subunit gamma/tau